ncbi:MAG: hypothetical protein BWY31_02502 [Lentisphaerae bacterium ADurb.Bin242]|nr:MAG: hypothetical protein BWY31_02502 [Lentisphaerae bacterium ADurb.Bin242]
MKTLFCLLALPLLLLADSGSPQYQRKFPRTMIYSRAQFQYNPVLNYGGRWVDRPLLLDPELNDPSPDGSTSVAALKAMGRNAMLYGLDGFASLSGNGTPSLIRKLERADIPGFSLLPEVYASGAGVYDAPLAIAKMRKNTDPVFLSAAKSSLTLKFKGKTVISSYNADMRRPPQFWKELLDDYRRTEGDRFLFLPLLEMPCGRAWHHWRKEYEENRIIGSRLEELKEHFRAYARATDGIYLACAPVRSNADRHTDIPFFKFMIRTATEVMCEPEFKDKLFAIAVRLGHENASRVGYIRGSYGTWCYRETMSAALAANPDLIIIPEWDEQNENTSLRPTLYNLSTFTRITRVFRGLSPELPGDDKTIPNLIVSYRKVVALGEKPEFELLGLPDSGGEVQARFLLRAPDGREIFRSPLFSFSGKSMEEQRFSIPSEEWASLPFVRPELEILRNGKDTVYRDGLQSIKIEPVSNCDYQYVKQPLRDLISAPDVKIEWSGKNRLKVRFDAKEPIAYAEILDDNMPVYTATRDGVPYWMESAGERVFCIHFQNLGAFSHTLDGTLSVSSANARWMRDTTFGHPSVMGKEFRGKTLKFRTVQKVGATRFFLALPREEAEKELLHIDVPGFFRYDLPLAEVLSAGAFGVPGNSIPVLSVSRQDFQMLHPPKLNRPSVEFEATISPHSKRSVIQLQVTANSGKIGRSAPLILTEASRAKGKIKVYSESSGKPVLLSLPEDRIPVFDYRFDPASGTVLRTSEGRRYWGMGGGYPAQVSGRLGAGNRDSSVFITLSDFPENAEKTSADQMQDAWGMGKPGQHLALPSGVISRRAAFTLSMELLQTDPKGVQTLLDNCSSSAGLLKIWTENGVVFLELTTDSLRVYTFDTGLKLSEKQWNRLIFHYGLDHFEISVDGRKFEGKCGYPGLYDTAASVGGGKSGWFKGKIRRITVDYRE